MTIDFNKNLKHTFVGISLAPHSNSETGIAILDENLKIITLDKIFTMDDMHFFFEKFVSKKNAVVMVSLAEDATMLNSKWKVLAKKFQMTEPSKDNFPNRQNWLLKYSNRASELLENQRKEGVDIFRFDIIEIKKALGLYGVYKHRSPADCKYLQSALKINFGIEDILSNMLPASQLEAILGAILAYKVYNGTIDLDYEILGNFKNVPILNLTTCPV